MNGNTKYQVGLGLLVLFVAGFLLMSLSGCGTDDLVAPAYAQAVQQATEFRFIHAGCPVNLLVWGWIGTDTIGPPIQFIGLDHDTTLTLAAERTSWFLTVNVNKPNEFKLEGDGPGVAFTQGGCFGG